VGELYLENWKIETLSHMSLC